MVRESVSMSWSRWRVHEYQRYSRRQRPAKSSTRSTGSGNRFVVAAVLGAWVVADFDSDLLVGERLHGTLVQQLVDTVTEHDVSCHHTRQLSVAARARSRREAKGWIWGGAPCSTGGLDLGESCKPSTEKILSLEMACFGAFWVYFCLCRHTLEHIAGDISGGILLQHGRKRAYRKTVWVWQFDLWKN